MFSKCHIGSRGTFRKHVASWGSFSPFFINYYWRSLWSYSNLIVQSTIKQEISTDENIFSMRLILNKWKILEKDPGRHFSKPLSALSCSKARFNVLTPVKSLFNLFCRNNRPSSYWHGFSDGSVIHVALSSCEEKPWKSKTLKQIKDLEDPVILSLARYRTSAQSCFPRNIHLPSSNSLQLNVFLSQSSNHIQLLLDFSSRNIFHITFNSCRCSVPTVSRYLLGL